MKKRIVPVLWLILLISLLVHVDGFAFQEKDFEKQLDLLCAQWNNNTPGGALLVTKEGNVIYKKCFGLANLEHKVPIRPNTLFELASVSKQFTAFATLLLEKEGRISLDDEIQKYLPELPQWEKPVTIRHLLHHTSGLWEYNILRNYAGFKYQDYYIFDDLYRLLIHQKEPINEPGTQWNYSNTGYFLLAEIIARVTGELFSSWTKKHIFAPLGMKDSYFVKNDCFRMVPNLANNYYHRNGMYYRGVQYNSEIPGPAHAFSSIDDMARWMDNFRMKKVGGSEIINKMFKKGTLNNGNEVFYGFGLGIGERHGLTTIGHSGQTASFKTQTLYCIENELAIVFLANDGSVSPERFVNKVLDTYLGIEPDEHKRQTDEKPLIELDQSILKGYAGGYKVEGNQVKLGVMDQGNRMLAAFDGLGMDWFYPTSENTFSNTSRNVHVTFLPGMDGRKGRLKMDLKGDIMFADRLEINYMTPDQMTKALAGNYYSEALGTVYKIMVKEKCLFICHRRYTDRKLHQTDTDEFLGVLGFVRFKRDGKGNVEGFSIFDEDFGFKPVVFKRISH